MNERLKNTLWLLAYSLAAGVLLALFAVIGSVIKYLFSILALYLGFRFFRKYDSLAMRIMFILFAIILYFVSTLVFVTINFIMQNPDMMTGV